ncbi:heparinase II/III family protein [Hansschlegelia plantiphila]|uniref:Heparinase n=1 Tax=Hansschlegelia plantiphila TaxID=374655 RepID=A0A9W6IZE7_9HYPH|nr:heparinase II/III family protein [Hansschlegelia plantiphila]GLK66455.1 heparinase [Hansschlegelia plantiphila]
MASLGEKAELVGLVLALGARAAARRVYALVRAPFDFAHRSPEKLLIAPHDLRTSDPTRAGEIYAGTFAFANRAADVDGGSPFLVAAPSADWAEALHGFGWLRHLRAADTTLARANGRALIDEWITLHGGTDRTAWRPEVVARRLISWFCHAPLILDGADKAFYRRFLRSISRQTHRLDRLIAATPDGMPRLTAAIALCYAGLCLSGESRLLRSAAKALATELDRQILADGGHASRNPAALVYALVDLLPLRQAFTARDLAPPQALNGAIDRMMPMLRFFRHPDGEFAQFNGAGPTPADLVATVLAYDDARGAPVEDATHSGYQRLIAGDAVAIVDVGRPPPAALSDEAHAGCLSFEFSADGDRVVVNCGAPRFGRADWAAAARATAAHSTVVVGDSSSCAFAPAGLKRFIGTPVVSGPVEVAARRELSDRGARIVASHDGYLRRFGVVHERSLQLSPDGRRLTGEDLFRASGRPRRRDGDVKIAARFHLHPAVRASARQDGQGVLLALPGGAAWSFSAPGFAVELAESVSLSGSQGPRRAEQILIETSLGGAPKIAWSFEAVDEARPRSRRLPQAPTLFGAPSSID